MALVASLVDTKEWAAWLELRTRAAQQHITEHLNEWTADPNQLQQKTVEFQHLQRTCQTYPEFVAACHKHFEGLADIENKLAKRSISVANKKGPTAIEKESYGELMFFGSIGKPFNFIPFFLSIWAALRTYVLPGISFLFPLLTLIAPYLLLTYVFRVPITLNRYTSMLQSMVSGQISAVLNPDAAAAAAATTDGAAWIKQLGVLGVTMVQGLLQPYWTYQHLKGVDHLLCEQGEHWLGVRRHYDGLSALMETHGLTFPRCPMPAIADKRMAAAHLLTEQTYITLAQRRMGALEVMIRLASHRDIRPVRWVAAEGPVFRLTDTYDFHVPAANRKPYTIVLDRTKGAHALLTGPNKGGKSTVLRSIGMAALLAHTYGCSIGTLVATPLDHLFVCLKPDDLPGSKSRFEREIEFTAGTLQATGRSMVLIDELYHSTNPPDALRSCQIYSTPLWAKAQTISVISTHLFEWVEHAPVAIQRMCCPATSTMGSICFHYTLEPGVCTVSSVDSLLEKNGLMAPRSVKA